MDLRNVSARIGHGIAYPCRTSNSFLLNVQGGVEGSVTTLQLLGYCTGMDILCTRTCRVAMSVISSACVVVQMATPIGTLVYLFSYI